MSLSQLRRILNLPDEDLQQMFDYAATLPKPEAADHFRNLLGDSAQALEFISTFNARRLDASFASAAAPAPRQEIEPAPKSTRHKKKKAPQIHTPAPRAVADIGPVPGSAYTKKAKEEDYIIKKPASPAPALGQSTGQSRAESSATAAAAAVPQTQRPSAGYLVSDLAAVPKSKPRSNPVSRTSTPKPSSSSTSTKINITGGTPMAGASTAIADLDAAIRALEITTNPTLSGGSGGPDDVARRRCNCVATRHPLQTAAPNCLSCGKVVCLKEGLGPCTFCGTPLLSAADVRDVILELRADRGRERQALDREAHRRPEVARAPAPFAAQRKQQQQADEEQEQRQKKLKEDEARALEHRNRLLGFQAQNARRTVVRDEAADFDVSAAVTGGGVGGGNMWASPEQRARELKRQQKVLREMEWNARPDYEKRREVISIDLVKGHVVKKLAGRAAAAHAETEEEEEGGEDGGRGVAGRDERESAWVRGHV